MSGSIKKDCGRLDNITLWKDSEWPDGTITRGLNWMDGVTVSHNYRNRLNVRITLKGDSESGTIAKKRANWLDGTTVSGNCRKGINVRITGKEGSKSGTIAKGR